MMENNEHYDEDITIEDTTIPKVDPSDPNSIPKFVDELPIPRVLIPDSRGTGYAYYEVEMMCAKHKFHRDFDETLIYGYNGMYPGPTIETMKGQTVYVKWINNLPIKHFLPLDKTLHGAIDNPEVRTVVHLHGADVAPDSDGFPEAWYSRNYQFTGPKYSRQVYKYPNDQQATTLWYHDHSLGTTRLNVYAGLAGFYIIHDFLEQRLELPKDKYDIPLIIQDKSFNSDSSLFYPDGLPNSPFRPSVVPAFNGQTMVVNGKVWPYLKVEPRKYRFRMLNASNTNGYTIKLSNGQSFWQIGTDGGMLDKPVDIKSFILEPAERIDFILDFSNLKQGDIITLKTEETDLKVDVMEFRVELPLKGEDKSVIPEELRHIEKLEETPSTPKRTLTLSATLDEHRRPMLLLNNSMFHDPATEMPEYDSIEIWEIVNLTPFAHPIHVHLVQFQILNRREFDVPFFNQTGQIRYFEDKPAEKPLDFETGWKDVVRAEPFKVTRIIAHFNNFTGDYVWHCHILEHEDHDMMRPLRVIKKYYD